MKTPLFNAPSLGSIQVLGYWVTLLVLLIGGSLIFLHFIFLVTMAVPVIGAFKREPKLPWRVFSVGSIVVATGYLLFQFLRNGSEGLIFYNAADSLGLAGLQVNFVTFLVVSSIFLPLSAACAIDRIRSTRKRIQGSQTFN